MSDDLPLSSNDASDPYRKTLPAPGSDSSVRPSDAAAALPPEIASADPASIFGKYVRTIRLGKGGMGEVWKAWDTGVGRWVALKFMMGGEEREIARFAREAHLAGTLQHPNIAQVYEVSELNGRHFIAMQFVEGITAGALSPRDARGAARVVRDAARALAEAHRHGVIHRDVKPENLMVRKARGKEEGQVYVMDFGLAKRTDAEARLSGTGAILGTPSYMAPEQARGGEIDGRADVWGLGATLYRILTGRPPFDGAALIDVLTAVQNDEPVPPRQFARTLPRDLEVVILKCLEKDPARRYASADDLADDLDRFLIAEPVHARPASLARRIRSRLVKRKAIAIAAAIGVLAIGGLAAALLPGLLREREGRRQSEEALGLWISIAGVFEDAERLARAGYPDRAKSRLEEGLTQCRATLQIVDLPEGHYFLGRLYRAMERRPEAMKEYDRAAEMKPALTEARLERGILLAIEYEETARFLVEEHAPHGVDLKLRKDFDTLEAAVPRLRDLRARAEADLNVEVGQTSWFDPTDRLYGLALLAKVRRHLDEARRLAAELLERDATHINGLIYAGWLEAEAGGFERALKHALMAASLHPAFAEAHILLCYIQFFRFSADRENPAAAGWLAEGLASGTKAADLDEHAFAAWYYLGHTRSALGDARGALEAYDRCLLISPGSLGALTNRALAKRESGDLPGALADFDAILKFDSNMLGAVFNRASTLDMLGRQDEALAGFACAREIAPAWSEPWNAAGKIELDRKHYEQAMALLDEALIRDAKNVNALNNRGVAHFENHRYADAIREFTAALDIQPHNFVSRGNRANARQYVHDWKGVLEDMEEALRIRPGAPTQRVMRGLALIKLYEFDRAVPDLQAGIAAGVDLPLAHWLLGQAFLAKNEPGKARVELEKATAADPTKVEAWKDLGLAHLGLRKAKDALAAFDKALALAPQDYEALRFRGSCYQALLNFKSAAADYEEALRLAPPDWVDRPATESYLKLVKPKKK